MPQGQKRPVGRPPKRAIKRLKTSASPAPISRVVATPEPPPPGPSLPFRVSDNRALPTLPEPQGDALPQDEYQSIASSAVLLASLDRSRVRWTQVGIFERYWTKPESGKHARPPPPNNPDSKWMKAKGPCRIRIEPHIFDAEMYVEEKEKIKPVKQYVPPPPPYQQPFQNTGPTPQRPFQPAHPQQRPQQASPPLSGQHHPHSSTTQPPTQPTHPTPAPKPVPPPSQVAAKPKTQPDPVISMLATRASSDPDLKILMKEVAVGKASQEQLRVFQRHIDDLTQLLKEREQAAAPAPTPPPAPAIQQQPPVQPQPRPYQAPQQQYHQPMPAYRPPPQWQPPPLPTSLPVILQFLTPGATEDRFLFPRNSILEKLTQQHLLVSFILTRRSEGKEIWQPITFMVEVAYGREELLNCVHRWVHPVDKVQAHMREVMSRCTRAPMRHLAFRLPQKSFAAEETEPIIADLVEEEKPKKARSNVVFVKTKKKDAEVEKEKQNEKNKATTNTEAKAPDKKIEVPTEPPSETAAGRGRTRRSLRGSQT